MISQAQAASYNHPYTYGLANTLFLTTPMSVNALRGLDRKLGNVASATENVALPILQGSISWKKQGHQSEGDPVPACVIFLGADDAAGQPNKLSVPWGVTARLKVKFIETIRCETTSSVEVDVVKRSLTSQPDKDGNFRHKSEFEARILSALGKVQAIASGLFIATGKYVPPTTLTISNDESDDQPIEVKRLQPYHILDNSHSQEMVSLQAITEQEKEDQRGFSATVNWHDGQGPTNCVHGGVMSIAVAKMIEDVFQRKDLKELEINYAKSIPLGGSSILEMIRDVEDENKLRFRCSNSKGETEFHGHAII